MRFFSTFCILLIGYFTYQALFSQDAEPINDEEIKEVLKSDSRQTSNLKRSLERVLPKIKDGTIRGHTPSPNVVIIEQDPNDVGMDSDDVIDRLESMKNASELEGLDFARWAIFTAPHSSEDKEKIFNHAVQILRPQQAALLSRDALTLSGMPQLYPRAMGVYTQGMGQAQIESFVQEIWTQSQDQNLKDFLYDYASARGLNLPE